MINNRKHQGTEFEFTVMQKLGQGTLRHCDVIPARPAGGRRSPF